MKGLASDSGLLGLGCNPTDASIEAFNLMSSSRRRTHMDDFDVALRTKSSDPPSKIQNCALNILNPWAAQGPSFLLS